MAGRYLRPADARVGPARCRSRRARRQRRRRTRTWGQGGGFLPDWPPTRPSRPTTTAHAQVIMRPSSSTTPPSRPTPRSASVAASAARARCVAPRIVSASPNGWSLTPDATPTLSTAAEEPARARTARTAATFTGFVDPTTTRSATSARVMAERGSDRDMMALVRDGRVIYWSACGMLIAGAARPLCGPEKRDTVLAAPLPLA